MGTADEGTIYIPLEEFWEFVNKYHGHNENVMYGVPRMNFDNQDIEIDYLFNSECSPVNQADYNKTNVAIQWENNRKK